MYKSVCQYCLGMWRGVGGREFQVVRRNRARRGQIIAWRLEFRTMCKFAKETHAGFSKIRIRRTNTRCKGWGVLRESTRRHGCVGRGGGGRPVVCLSGNEVSGSEDGGVFASSVIPWGAVRAGDSVAGTLAAPTVPFAVAPATLRGHRDQKHASPLSSPV